MARAEGSSLEQAFGLRPPRLFRRGNQEGGLECFCQFWFLWVDALLVVFRRAKKICPLLCPRLILAYRQNSPADFGASIFFPTPSLIARSWRGTGVHPREDNPAVLVSLRLPIPSGISSRGLHAPGVSPPGLPGQALELYYEQVRYRLRYVQNCRMRLCGV